MIVFLHICSFIIYTFAPLHQSTYKERPPLGGRFTPFNLSIADLYIIILPKAELLYIKGDLSVTK